MMHYRLGRMKTALFALLILIMTILPVYAGISGVFDFKRGSMIVEGVIRGLGNTKKNDVVTVLTGTATVQALCQNKGGNIAPGRNPIFLSMTIQSPPLQADSNGNAPVFIRITDPATISPPPVSPTPKQAGCPNGNWSVVGLVENSVRWQSAQVEVRRNGTAELVRQFACVDDGATLTCN